LRLLDTNAGQNVFNENETMAKYEIMDGAPVRGTYVYAACELLVNLSLQNFSGRPPLTSTWPHLNNDVGLEEGEY